MSIYLRFTPLRFYWVGICILRLQAEPTPLDGATKPIGPGNQGPRKKSVTTQDRLFIRSEYVLMTDDATLFREVASRTYTYIFIQPRVPCPLTWTSPAVFARPPPLQRQGAPRAKGSLGRLRLASLGAARGS